MKTKKQRIGEEEEISLSPPFEPQHRLEPPSVIHNTATGLHRSTTSEVVQPAAPPPPCRVRFLPPAFLFFRCMSFPPVCRIVLHAGGGEGENNSPPIQFTLLGQADAGPALFFFLLWARRVMAHKYFWVGQNGSGPALRSGSALAQTKIG